MKNTTLTAAISRIESQDDNYNVDDLLLVLMHANEAIKAHKSTLDPCDIGEAYGFAHAFKEIGHEDVSFSDKEALDECIRLAKIGVN